MASPMLRPNVMSFLDIITHAGDVVLDLEEVKIFNNSSLLNKTLIEGKIPQRTGLMILSIKKAGTEDLMFNPPSTTVLEEGDVMIVLGTEEQVNKLRDLSDDPTEVHIYK